jgi:hypothetical protein
MNMLQFYLRPLKPAVAQLVHDLPAEGDVDLRRHCEDLLDHVVVLEEQVRVVQFATVTLYVYINKFSKKGLKAVKKAFQPLHKSTYQYCTTRPCTLLLALHCAVTSHCATILCA